MGDEVLFRQRVRKASATQGLGCLIAASLVPSVVVAMNAYLLLKGEPMTDGLESLVRASTPIGLFLAVGFGLVAFVTARKSASQLELRRVGDRLALAIEPDVRIEGPFEIQVGWERAMGGKGVKLFWCDLSRGDELLIRLSQEMGSIYSPPEGWPRHNPPMDRAATHGGYSVPRIEKLVKLMQRS